MNSMQRWFPLWRVSGRCSRNTPPFFRLRMAWHGIVGLLVIIGIWYVPAERISLTVPLLRLPFEAYWDVEMSIGIKILASLFTVLLVLIYHYARDWGKKLTDPLGFLRIHFDRDGIHNILEKFTEQEKEALRIHPNWEKYHTAYLSDPEPNAWLLSGPVLALIGDDRHRRLRVPRSKAFFQVTAILP